MAVAYFLHEIHRGLNVRSDHAGNVFKRSYIVVLHPLKDLDTSSEFLHHILFIHPMLRPNPLQDVAFPGVHEIIMDRIPAEHFIGENLLSHGIDINNFHNLLTAANPLITQLSLYLNSDNV